MGDCSKDEGNKLLFALMNRTEDNGLKFKLSKDSVS